MKEQKKHEREDRKREKEKKREERKREREEKKWKERDKEQRKTERGRGKELNIIVEEFENLAIDSSDDEATCPKCGTLCSTDSGLWICCDKCDQWYNFACTNIVSESEVPDIFVCDLCK